MNINLEGQTAVVTGASRGIGAAIAETLASSGANVILNYRSSAEQAERVAQKIISSGGKAELMAFNVADELSVKENFKTIAARYGGIDILVNNAGISKDALLLRIKPEDINEIIDINLKGAFFCSFHASRYMLKQHSGRIINISSIVGLGGNAGQSMYSATKAGLIGLTKSLAKELGSRNVLVNAVAPGIIETDMTKGLDLVSASEAVALKRTGIPEDVANAVLFLCSNLSSYITGQVLIVDGGLYS